MKDYIECMKNYSALASWAVWESNSNDGEFKKEKDLVENINFSNYKSCLQKSNTVFLAMNPGGTFNEDEAKKATRIRKASKRSWSNFHNVGKSRDYLLAQAIKNTPEWGSYMTDIFPIVGSDSSVITKFINSKENKEIVEKLILEFDEEMSLLFSKDKEVKLLCIGKSSYNWANKFLVNSNIPLKKTYKTFYLPHYSGANNGGIKNKAIELGVENYYPTVIKTLLKKYREQ